ncbi:MAG: hypothetical protein DDT35_00431 [Firmicutes bacterium]|nr:hypothetical protein [Bacillota bacterium]
MKIRLKDVEAFQVLLLRKGLSQRELARVAKIHEGYVSMILRETHSPGPGVAARICKVLEVAFDDIFYVAGQSSEEDGAKC